MWLYTINVWWAPRKDEFSRCDYTQITERVESRVYRGADVNIGLALLAEYIQVGKAKWKTSVTEYRLLGITQLDDDVDVASLVNLGCHEISRDAINALIND